MNLIEIKNFCIQRHRYVNQQYDGHDYSLHISAVAAQVRKWASVLKLNSYDTSVSEAAAWGHDLIEDTRLSYNDVVTTFGKDVADVIFACTESTGRNRKERHDEAFYIRLTRSRLGVFVKLCDLIANTLYSKLTVSGMEGMHRKEWLNYKEQLNFHYDEFRVMIEYLDNLHKL